MADSKKFLDQAGLLVLWNQIKTAIAAAQLGGDDAPEDYEQLKGQVSQLASELSQLSSGLNETILQGIIAWVADADEDYDTLKEIADYIKSDKTNAAAIVADIAKLKELMNAEEGDLDALDDVDARIAEAVSTLTALIEDKQDKLTGEEGQFVTFDAEGNVVAQEIAALSEAEILAIINPQPAE